MLFRSRPGPKCLAPLTGAYLWPPRLQAFRAALLTGESRVSARHGAQKLGYVFLLNYILTFTKVRPMSAPIHRGARHARRTSHGFQARAGRDRPPVLHAGRRHVPAAAAGCEWPAAQRTGGGNAITLAQIAEIRARAEPSPVESSSVARLTPRGPVATIPSAGKERVWPA